MTPAIEHADESGSSSSSSTRATTTGNRVCHINLYALAVGSGCEYDR
jgi:hypothetical protein